MQLIDFDKDMRGRGPHGLLYEVLFVRAVMATGDIEDLPRREDGKYAVDFQINGKEVDLKKFFEEFEAQYDAEVASRAREILKDKLGFEKAEEELDRLRAVMKESVNQFMERWHKEVAPIPEYIMRPEDD